MSNSVQVVCFRFHLYFVEILWPVAECAVIVEICRVYLGDTTIRISGKPVQCNVIWINLALRDKRLDGADEKRAMSLGYHAHSAINCPLYQVPEIDLRSW